MNPLSDRIRRLGFWALMVLVMVRRLQSAKLPSALALLLLVPGIGFIYWAALLFIPERSPSVQA